MPVEFSLEFEPRSRGGDAYRSFISGLRKNLTDGYSHNVPALIFQETNPTRFFQLVLRTSNRSVTFRLRMDNLYLIGYQMETGKWLEFKNAAGKHLITEQGTEFLGFDGSYTALQTAAHNNIEDLKVGFKALEGAINGLASSVSGEERARSLMVVIMMFCEATRLNDVLDFLVQNYDNENAKIGIALMDQVRAWGQLSEALFRADAFPEERLKVKEWRIVDIVKMVGIALRYCFRTTATTQLDNVEDGQCYNGLSLAEVFSVRIQNSRTTTRQIYGTITVTDGLRTQSIYNRSSDKPENITGNSGKDLLLTGPSEAAISALGDFTIKLLLHDKATNNKVILDQSIDRNFFNFGNVYDRLVSEEFNVDGGSLTVNYAVFRNAVAAKVEIGVSAEGKNQVSVYGSVSTSCWDNAADQANSLLFSRARDDPAVVSSGALIPLLRSIVATPLGSTFKVMADLYDGTTHFISGDEPVTFQPKISGEDSKTITKGNYKVNMKISWIIAF